MANTREIKAVITAEDKASAVLKKFGQNSVDASKKALLAVTAAATAAVAFGVSSIKAYADSENQIAQTNAVLKSTGGIAGVTADQVTKLATALQSQTKFSDEDVRSVENLLLTFTSIGKDIFPQATKTVLDMATALGEDTQSASIQLGKALQDPIRGITALRRVGVNFSDSQQEVIKKLVETGHKAEAQKLILKELNKEFGGSAVAAGNTAAGALAKLRNQFDDLQEAVGQTLVQALLPLANWFGKWIEQVNEAGGLLAYLQGIFDRNKNQIIAVAGAIAGSLVPAIAIMIFNFGKMLLLLSPWMAIGAAIALIILHWNDITKAFGGVVDSLKHKWDELINTIKAFASGVLGFFKTQIDRVVKAWQIATGWVERHKKGLQQIATFLTIIFGPLLLKVGAQAAVMAAKMVAAAARSAGAWVVAAAKTAYAWTINFAKMSAKAVAHSVMSAGRAVLAGAAWTVQAARTSARWLASMAIMSARVIAFSVLMVARAAVSGFAWLVALGPVGWATIGVIAGVALIVKYWSRVTGFFKAFPGWLAGVFRGITSIIISPFKAAFDWIEGAIKRISGMLSNLKGAAGSVIGAPGKAASGVGSFITSHLPHFADGGIVPGPKNSPQLAVVHGGERVIPTDKSSGMTTINIHVNAGAYMGSQVDARKYALQIFKALQDVAATKNKSVSDLLGAT